MTDAERNSTSSAALTSAATRSCMTSTSLVSSSGSGLSPSRYSYLLYSSSNAIGSSRHWSSTSVTLFCASRRGGKVMVMGYICVSGMLQKGTNSYSTVLMALQHSTMPFMASKIDLTSVFASGSSLTALYLSIIWSTSNGVGATTSGLGRKDSRNRVHSSMESWTKNRICWLRMRSCFLRKRCRSDRVYLASWSTKKLNSSDNLSITSDTMNSLQCLSSASVTSCLCTLRCSRKSAGRNEAVGPAVGECMCVMMPGM
mmetsp:Transcript_45996/g.114381  ORF Transcript_45996/g.114381 Transcript_45996/m.114381 type:complete len:257 (-) Transcript_45996:125-895(-)